MPRVGERITNNLSFLRTIAKSRPAKRNHQLKIATKDELLSIVEIALNILRGKFHLTPRQKRKLRPFAGIVQRISQLRSEKGARRLLQRGGAIGTAVASIVAPILLDILRASLHKNGA